MNTQKINETETGTDASGLGDDERVSFREYGAYYRRVASYYDEDARDFEQRYEENAVLRKIRNDFRRITTEYPFKKALEIGCGPGLDVAWFARNYPDREIDAIDVSPEMIRLAHQKIREYELENTRVAVGSVEDIDHLFPGERYDMVYVFFGGLNTVFDLKKAAEYIRGICADEATLVLTFVNRFYLADVPLWLARGKVSRAFDRLLNRWEGYSAERTIPSRTYTQSDIRRAFSGQFRIIRRKGYCITYPAWYRSHLLPRLPENGEKLWKLDQAINNTPLWNTGEYTLYVMKPIQK